MTSKFHYYWERFVEAPLPLTIKKVGQIMSKKFYRIFYGVRRNKLYVVSNEITNHSMVFMEDLGSSIRLELILSEKLWLSFKDPCIKRAQNIVDGEFPCLGFGNVQIRKGAKWQSDPIHDFNWPNVYFDGIDFVAREEKCDVKIPWEMSRFQYLLWLAEGHVLDSDGCTDYQKAFEEILDDWIAHNKPAYGVNWIVAMEVAIRSVNLALSASVFWNGLSFERRQKILWMLDEHRKFIKRFPEFSDVSGNHYLSNLMGLAVINACLFGPNHKLTRESFNDFYYEADMQFEIEGGHLERAPIYHRLCVDMIAIVYAFEKRIGNCSQLGEKIFGRAISFYKTVADQKGQLPVIADCDSGHVLWFGENARDSRSSTNIYSGLIEGKLKWNHIDSNIIWHMAVAKTPVPSTSLLIEENDNISPKVRESSGFISGQTKDFNCVMRVGEQGLRGRASHDHDDALSLWLSYKGIDIIVEMGCHSYTLDQSIRSQYIGSLAHNLVQPHGQNRYSGKIGSIVKTVRGAQTAKSWKIQKEQTGISLAAELAPSQAENQAMSEHKRTVKISSDELDKVIVKDNWVFSDKMKAEMRWHFSPRCRIKVSKEGSNVIDVKIPGEKFHCQLSFKSVTPNVIKLFEFQYSEKYGNSEISQGVSVVLADSKNGSIQSQFEFRDI